MTVHTAAGETPNRKSLEPVETFTDQAAHFAEEYFDFKFQGAAQQCGDEKSCRELEAQFEWDTYMSVPDRFLGIGESLTGVLVHILQESSKAK